MNRDELAKDRAVIEAATPREQCKHYVRGHLLRLTVSEAEADIVLRPIMFLIDEYHRAALDDIERLEAENAALRAERDGRIIDRRKLRGDLDEAVAGLQSIERDTTSSDLWLRQKAHDCLSRIGESQR